MQQNTAAIRAEQRSAGPAALLWACAAARNDQEAQVAIRAALTRGEIDWPECARMSLQQGVAPLLAHRLRPFTGHPHLPADAAVCFARMLEANALRNQVMFREAARLVRALSEVGIRSLVLKGVGLALSVYPQPALRNFADFDLLVDECSLEDAGAVACSQGFTPGYAEADTHLLHQTYVTCCPEDILTETLPLEYEPELSRELIAQHSHRVVVEIHQGLFRDASGIARRVDNAPLWESPRCLRFPDGTGGLLPSPEVMLVHLADHAACHGFARLMYFVDMALILRQPALCIDWDRIHALASRYQTCKHVYRCLEFVQREFGAPVPSLFLHRLARPAGARRAIRPLQRATILTAEREFGPGVVLQSLLHSHNLQQFGVALRHILFPPPVIMRRLYRVRNPLSLAAFYLLRPLILCGHLSQALLRRIHRRH